MAELTWPQISMTQPALEQVSSSGDRIVYRLAYGMRVDSLAAILTLPTHPGHEATTRGEVVRVPVRCTCRPGMDGSGIYHDLDCPAYLA